MLNGTHNDSLGPLAQEMHRLCQPLLAANLREMTMWSIPYNIPYSLGQTVLLL